MQPDDLPCSECPVRDVGQRYPVGDQRDPWRRMPHLFDELMLAFGRPMYNVASRTRRETDNRVATYCRRVRQVHGDDCSVQRMRLCNGALREVARRTRRSRNVYAAWQAMMNRLHADDALYGQLHRTRDHRHVVDPQVVFRALDDDVQ